MVKLERICSNSDLGTSQLTLQHNRGIFWFKTSARVLITSFILSIICFLAFLCFHGFGYDGDSLVNGAQFVKLINPAIYGTYDGGTQPKILTMALVGTIYEITGNLYLLTFLSIIINSFMFAILCKWIYELNGSWVFALIGFIINYRWLFTAINSDNPAFSVPFIFIGLYYCFHKHKIYLGAVLLMISSLFRPGTETIILILIAWQLFNGDRRIWFLVGLFACCLMHTVWGYRLGYANEAGYLAQCLFLSEDLITEAAVYKHSVFALYPYIKAVIKLLSEPISTFFIFPAILGCWEIFKNKLSIRFVLLGPLSTLIVLAAAFVYGSIGGSRPDKVLEYSLIVPMLAGFYPFDSAILLFHNIRFRRMALASLFIILIALSAFFGNHLSHYSQVRTDGSGDIGWTQLKDVGRIVKEALPGKTDINAIIDQGDVVFFTLEIGLRAREINFLENNLMKDTDKLEKTDVILTSKSSPFLSALSGLDFKKYDIYPDRVLFIRESRFCP